ncbi:MAG: adenylate kinase [Halobacteriovoraceae bacterium]|nr:adenylate kinase [Halobacteriovoraceae bacterium]|tara:strand:- start:59925 stop:60560 length:636 start_codon:yes stop_codon:yes gene_type:complete
MKENLIFLGAPGSGKGTQSAKLVEANGYEHVSTGNLLRAEIQKETELGKKVKEVMANGQLVSDELVVELLKANLELKSTSYIFDGYPRNIKQAKTLEGILNDYPYTAVYFKIDTEKMVERLTNRRMTKDGKHIYNLKTNPPKQEGICDVTGEKLIQRKDDTEEVVRSRMEVFNSTMGEVVDYYSSKNKLVEVDADQPMQQVYDAIIKKIKQ